MKTAINNIKIFDGTRIAWECGSVLFDESGILAVGEGPFEAEQIIDGRGRTLTPGLIDGHVHLGTLGAMSPNSSESELVQSGALIAAQAQQVWSCGITTMCNCTTGANADIHVRDLIRGGLIPGARIVACGCGICITGGHCWTAGHQCDSELEALRAAREQLRLGADFVKLFATGGMGTRNSIPNVAQLTEGQMSAAAEAAAAVGAFSRAHATGLEGAKRAVRAGVRIIDHIQMDEELAAMMAEAEAFYCPTIVTRYNILHTEDPRYQYMRAKADSGDLDRKKRALELCRKHGIRIIAGTDAGPNDMTPLGSSLWTELNLYAEFGLSPVEALTAATSGAALALRIEAVTGSVAPGLCADLAVFDGDPTVDLHALNTLAMTFQSGIMRWRRM